MNLEIVDFNFSTQYILAVCFNFQMLKAFSKLKKSFHYNWYEINKYFFFQNLFQRTWIL